MVMVKGGNRRKVSPPDVVYMRFNEVCGWSCNRVQVSFEDVLRGPQDKAFRDQAAAVPRRWV